MLKETENDKNSEQKHNEDPIQELLKHKLLLRYQTAGKRRLKDRLRRSQAQSDSKPAGDKILVIKTQERQRDTTSRRKLSILRNPRVLVDKKVASNKSGKEITNPPGTRDKTKLPFSFGSHHFRVINHKSIRESK